MITFDPDALSARVAELEESMGEPSFWDDQQRAAKISAEHARLTRRRERYDALTGEAADLKELAALASEDGELDEVAESVATLKRELDRLQVEALFSGEYDSGDAVVSIHAGEGGTDAQDWAEMLLRMYLRWSESRGFKTELLEASPGEEAGLKSATFTVAGENAYGVLKAERGVHRLVRLSPFAVKVADLRPASSPGLASTRSTWKPLADAQRRYMRSRISAQSCASVPPVPAWMVTTASPPSYSPVKRASSWSRASSSRSGSIDAAISSSMSPSIANSSRASS